MSSKLESKTKGLEKIAMENERLRKEIKRVSTVYLCSEDMSPGWGCKLKEVEFVLFMINLLCFLLCCVTCEFLCQIFF